LPRCGSCSTTEATASPSCALFAQMWDNSSVPSVDPSSTTTTSTLAARPAAHSSTASSVPPSRSCSLNAGITIESCIGGLVALVTLDYRSLAGIETDPTVVRCAAPGACQGTHEALADGRRAGGRPRSAKSFTWPRCQRSQRFARTASSCTRDGAVPPSDVRRATAR